MRLIHLVESKKIDVRPEPSKFADFRLVAYVDGKFAGDLRLGPNRHDPSKWSVTNVWVDPEFRRQGVATALYNYAYRAGYKPLVPDVSKLSPAGAAFWDAHRMSRLRLGKPLPPMEWKPSGPKD